MASDDYDLPDLDQRVLMHFALLDGTRRGDVVLDPFGGAGSTLIAATRTGRHARLLEFDPAYVDVILRRWHYETGTDPVRAEDGLSLSTLERAANQSSEGCHS